MPAIRRILVPIKDMNGKSMPAVLKAAQLARAFGSEVELYHSLATPVQFDPLFLRDKGIEALEQELRQEALRRLESIADRIRQHSIRVNVAAEWDFPAYEAIVRRALRIKADLIVVEQHIGRHRAAGLLRLTDWELVRHSPVPVLLVKNSRPYRRPVVLAAIDPAHAFAKPARLDGAVLREGHAVSRHLRGSLHAVHAYTPVPINSLPARGVTPAIVNGIALHSERTAQKHFERALARTRIAKSHRYLIGRHPIDAIAEAARKCRSAIVVMGAISRSGIRQLLIGNTAERIIDELSCDILVVKPAAFRSRVPSKARGVRLTMSSAPMPGFF